MDVYRQETREILRRFMACELTYPECVAGLNAALDGLVRDLRAEDLPALRTLLASNDEQLKAAVKRRRRHMTACRSAGLEKVAYLPM